MATTMNPPAEQQLREVQITRIIHAPRELVWKAWTEARQIEKWWGPRGFTNECEVDLRRGGVMRVMSRKGNNEYPTQVIYHEIIPHERLVMVDLPYCPTDDRRKGLTVQLPPAGTEPDSFLRVTLENAGPGKTRLTMTSRFPNAELRNEMLNIGMTKGFSEGMSKLAESLGVASHPDAAPTECDFYMTRLFNAPRELVYRAWTEPKHLKNWWAPQGFTTPVYVTDLRHGGAFRYVMRGPDGTDYPMNGRYLDVVPNEWIVVTEDFSSHPDEWHDMVNPNRDRAAGKPAVESTTIYRFEESGAKTMVTIHTRFATAEMREAMAKMGMDEGWGQCLDKLADELAVCQRDTNADTSELPNERDIELTRLFNAPRALVWKTWTEAKHVQQWWGPQMFDNPVCEWDARPGGKILIHMRGPDGVEYPMTGEFIEVTAPETLVFSSVARDHEGNALLESRTTVTLTEHNDKTKLVARATARGLVPFAPQMLAGMEMGWNQQLDKLETLLAQAQKGK